MHTPAHRFVDNAAMPNNAFHLSRWFAIVGLISISLLTVVSAVLLSRFLTDRMLHQEGVLTMEFIHSLVMVENSADYFRLAKTGSAEVASTFHHVGKMPDVLRASAHSLDHHVIWSSDPSIVGMQFKDNPELDRALAGELVVHEDFEDHHTHKTEHASLSQDIGYFVEIYFPVRDSKGQVVGAIELYKSPHALFEAIRTGEQAIWVAALLGGLFLYSTLFWLVRRADNLIRHQQEQLVQSETLAAVGEMGSAVAHGIRNPLATIRSSAELSLETADSIGREAANDIIAEVDRLEGWVRELLSYVRPVGDQLSAVSIGPLLQEQQASFERDARRRHFSVQLDVADDVGAVEADAPLLTQVLVSLIANAFEAMAQKQQGSQVVLGARKKDKRVEIWVEDDGPGIPPAQQSRIFKPFYTTKPKGLGVGLPLAKRVIRRFGGDIEVLSSAGHGTRVVLTLKAVNTSPLSSAMPRQL